MRHANPAMFVRLLLAFWMIASPAVALAGPPKSEFNRLVKEAERLYSTGKYTESAERLIEAYPYDPNPRIIYNIARAYDQAGELESSLEYYQRYVGSSEGTDPVLLKRSALSIDRLRGLIAQREEEKKQKAQMAAEAKQAQERAAQETAAKQKAEQELRAREKAAAEAHARSQRNGKIAAYALGGAAVAGLVTGSVFGLQARGSRDAFTNAETVADKQRLQSTTRTQALIADVGMGVGIVAAVLAVIVYPKGTEAPKTSTQVSLIPAANGAGVEVRF